MKDQDNFNIKKNLKPVCVRIFVLKVIAIPFSLATARLLANIVQKAMIGDVTAVATDSVIIVLLAVLSRHRCGCHHRGENQRPGDFRR